MAVKTQYIYRDEKARGLSPSKAHLINAIQPTKLVKIANQAKQGNQARKPKKIQEGRH